MNKTIRILLLEDNPADADLVEFELQEAGIDFTAKRVMTEKDFVGALKEFLPDLILSDYDLPQYNGAWALAEAKTTCPEIPFILVTGAISEERAVDILISGAKDYVMKNRLDRLVPAVERVLKEAEEIRARKTAQEELLEAHRMLESRVKKRTAKLRSEINVRKNIEKALRESEKKFISLYSAMIEGVALHKVVFDSSGTPVDYLIIDVNPAYQPITGLERESVIGKRASEIYGTGVAPYLELYSRVTLSGIPESFETYFSPMKKHFAISVFSPGPEQFATVFNDITLRKLAETQLEKARDDSETLVLKRTVELEKALMELRVPLRAIDGYTRMILKKQADNFDEDTNERFSVIRKNIEIMGKLIDDLLTFSRLGGKDIAVSQLKMDDIIRDAWKEQQVINPGRDMTLTVKGMPVVYGDQSLIKQVYANLLANAVKFTRNIESARIEVGGYTENGEHVFYVRDNGVGFDMECYHKLFGVFQRLHSAEEFEGTGVGLATVLRIITRHGGRVWAEGKPGEGAVFYFTLPQSVK